MINAAELVRLIKKAAVEAVGAEKPVAFCFGKVISTSPLKISVDQKLVLGESQLILTKAVTDHWVDGWISFYTEEQEEQSIEQTEEQDNSQKESRHRHCCKGNKKIFLSEGLKEGEEVILLRSDGGQRFIVIDRIFDSAAEGEWIG